MADELTAEPEPTLPPSVRLIWRLRDHFARHRGRVVGVALALLFASSLGKGLYTIDNGEAGALLRFGAVVDESVQPGLHYRMPLGIEQIVERRTGEVFRLEITGDWEPRLSLVSGDENLIVVGTTVQYRILRLGAFLFSVDDAESLIHQTVRAELLEAAAGLGVDDLLTSGKAAVQQQVQLNSQERLDRYGLGIGLVSVNLQTVDPPEEADEAFRAVLDARADAARGVSLASSRADRRLSQARGAAAQIVAQAEATADRRLRQAQSAAQRFSDLSEQKRRSPQLTRTDLYTRSVGKALAETKLIVLPPGGTDRLDLNLIDPAADKR